MIPCREDISKLRKKLTSHSQECNIHLESLKQVSSYSPYWYFTSEGTCVLSPISLDTKNGNHALKVGSFKLMNN